MSTHTRSLHPDLESLSRAAAEAVVAAAKDAVAQRRRFALALAGGGTPQRLYELLATEPYRSQMPWEQTYLFWGDERFVPIDHEHSNYRMAHEALLQHLLLSPSQVFRMPTEGVSPEACAHTYETGLRSFFEQSEATFDLALLGLGSDGHTASLFPENAPHAHTTERWVEAVIAPPRLAVAQRLTLTLPCLNASRRVFFLAAGAGKADPVRRILARTDDAAELPAAHIQAQEEVIWFLDEAAAPK